MKYRILIPTMALCIFLLALAGVAQAQDVAYPVTIKHRLGETTLKAQPQRIVVMDMGMLDTIDALNLDVTLALPKGIFPKYLEKYSTGDYVDVGNLKEFNLETINGFKPDLIIISGRQQDYYKELSAIAPVFLAEINTNDYMNSVRYNLESMAGLFNRKADVDAALDKLNEKISAVNKVAQAKNYSTLVLLTNDGKISAYGSGSRFAIIHDVLGLKPADQSIKVSTHGQLVNYEFIAEQNPDLILVVDRSAAIGSSGNKSKILDNVLVNSTNAAKNDRIVYLDPGLWYLSGGGLVSLNLMIDEVANALNK